MVKVVSVLSQSSNVILCTQTTNSMFAEFGANVKGEDREANGIKIMSRDNKNIFSV